MKTLNYICVIVGLIFTPLNLIVGNKLGAVFGVMAFICGVIGLLDRG